jgi:hypothetical protein
MAKDIRVLTNLMIFIRIKGKIGAMMRKCLRLIRILRRKGI